MMLLPTQDEKLRDRLVRMVDNATEVFQWTNSKNEVHKQHELVISEILKEIEKEGYHKGLPSSIEEALNSRDGSYRP